MNTKKFWFTFGCGHLLAKYCVVIEAEFYEDARDIMFDSFGAKWGFQYDSAEEAGVERWGLKELR